jgi:hypothetical protein
MTDIQSSFARSDAYLSALMHEVRSVPAANASLTMGRRTFFKLAGAGAAGLGAGLPLRRPGVRGEAGGRQRPGDERLHPHRPGQHDHHLFQMPGDRPGHQDLLRRDHCRRTRRRLEPCRDGAGRHQYQGLWLPGLGRLDLHPARLGPAASGRRRRQGDADRRRRQAVGGGCVADYRAGFGPDPCRQRQVRNLRVACRRGGENAGARSQEPEAEDPRRIPPDRQALSRRRRSQGRHRPAAVRHRCPAFPGMVYASYTKCPAAGGKVAPSMWTRSRPSAACSTPLPSTAPACRSK